MSLPGADGRSLTRLVAVTDGRSVRVVFGAGSLSQVAAEVQVLGSRFLLISGRREVDPATLVGAELGDDLVGWIPEVASHVPAEVAARAVDEARRRGADMLVSVGGGSATGLAKAVVREWGLPIVAVPTTYAGSEMRRCGGGPITAPRPQGGTCECCLARRSTTRC